MFFFEIGFDRKSEPDTGTLPNGARAHAALKSIFEDGHGLGSFGRRGWSRPDRVPATAKVAVDGGSSGSGTCSSRAGRSSD